MIARQVSLVMFSMFLLTGLHKAYSKPVSQDFDVLERILFPCLVELSVDYESTEDQKLKERIESRVYKYQFTYWIHALKFGEERSELTEKAFSRLNHKLLESERFTEMVKTGSLFSDDDGQFLGLRFSSKASLNKEIILERTDREEFDKLNEEFLEFLYELRDKRRMELRRKGPGETGSGDK